MYGTIYYVVAQPGRRDEIRAYMEQYGRLGSARTEGGIASFVCWSDDLPDQAAIVAIFDGRDSYRANAEAPQQHERYLRLRELLADDPTWYDGRFEMTVAPGDLGQARYGVIRHLFLRPGQQDELVGLLDSGHPGSIGEYFCLLDSDDNEVIQVALFESKHRSLELHKSVAHRERQDLMWELLVAEPETFAGPVSPFLRV